MRQYLLVIAVALIAVLAGGCVASYRSDSKKLQCHENKDCDEQFGRGKQDAGLYVCKESVCVSEGDAGAD